MKRWLLQQLAGRRHRHRPANAKPWLLITYNGLGDMLMTLPVINAFTGSGIALQVLAHPRNAGVLQGHPAIERLWVADANKARAHRQPDWPSDAYEKVIYLGERLSFHPLMNLQQLRCQELLSLPFKAHQVQQKALDPLALKLVDGYLGDASEAHFASRMASVLAPLGLTSGHPGLPFTPPAKRLTAGTWLLNPCGSQEGNTMPASLIARLLSRLPGPVAAYNNPGNQQLLAPWQQQIQWLTSPTVADAAGWLLASTGLISTDTGIGHLACSLDVPTLIVRRDEHWRACCDPLWGTHKVVVAHSDRDLSAVSDRALGEAMHWLQAQRWQVAQ